MFRVSKSFDGIASGSNLNFANLDVTNLRIRGQLQAQDDKFNIKIGTAAGQELSKNTGSDNILIGSNSGNGLTEGEQNTFVGNNTGNIVQIANRTVLAGHRSGASLTTSINSVVIGAFAAETSTSSRYNVIVGDEAAYSFSDFKNTICIGSQACKELKTGEQNVCIGSNAAQHVVQGNDNVILGHQAGCDNLQTGDTNNNNNVIIGSGATCAGSGNVVIGKNAGGNWVTGNTLVIHNSNSTTPLVQGKFSVGGSDPSFVIINGDLEIKGQLTVQTFPKQQPVILSNRTTYSMLGSENTVICKPDVSGADITITLNLAGVSPYTSNYEYEIINTSITHSVFIYPTVGNKIHDLDATQCITLKDSAMPTSVHLISDGVDHWYIL